jgi:FkbM family methyltransferase
VAAPTIYIGQGDVVRTRLEDHFINKDFWTTAAVFVSNAAGGLNRAHATWLEHALIQRAIQVDQSHLDNGKEPQEPHLSEPERADTQTFLRDMLQILPLIGLKCFEKPKTVAAPMAHAGAFFGDALPALSKATRGTVWAFEPNPQSFRAAQITALMNDLKNVNLMNCALGAGQEQRKLVVRDFSGRSLGGLSQIVDDRFAKRGDETIDIATIDIDTLAPRTSAVSILHLDLEGFEEFALLGATEIIKRCRPLLILETVPSPNSDAERSLKALGYRVRRTFDANTLLDCD